MSEPVTSSHKHPNSADLYTPITPELQSLFLRMRVEHGTWRKVAALSGTRLRVMRNLRGGKRKAISQKLLDRICTSTKVGSIDEFTWFTADDLVALGIWDPVQYVEGLKRVQGGDVRFRTKDEIEKDRKQAKAGKKRGVHRKRTTTRKYT